MAKYLDTPNRYGGTSDHGEEIAALTAAAVEFARRTGVAEQGGRYVEAADLRREARVYDAAALLLVCHDETGHNLTAGSAGAWAALVEDCLQRLGFAAPDGDDLILTNGA